MSDIKQYEPLWGSWYVDDEPIGEGAFGRVYKVHKEEFGNVYYAAVKMMSIPQSESEIQQALNDGLDEVSVRTYFQAFVTDIVQEINLMNAFKGNTNIVSLEDHRVVEHADRIGWDILIRMELLSTLPAYNNTNPMSTRDVVRLGMDISRALELCASRKIIHRDIKPENIFVSQYGDFKLGDFGVARKIEHTVSPLSKKGTFAYMAPEVFKGNPYGPSVDIYSLGIVMYQYLNGSRTPFLPPAPEPMTPQDRIDAMNRRMNGESIPAITSIDPELNDIVLKACAYNPEERYSDASEFRTALEKFSGAEPTPPVFQEVLPEPPRHERKRLKAMRQEEGGKTTGILPLRRDEPEKIQVPEAKIEIPAKIMNVLKFGGGICFGLMAVLSFLSGDYAFMAVYAPLHMFCAFMCLFGFKRDIFRNILLAFLGGYIVSGMILNFPPFDYIILSTILGLLAAEAMKTQGRKCTFIFCGMLVALAIVSAVYIFSTLGGSQSATFRNFKFASFGVPIIMALLATVMLLSLWKKSIAPAGIAGLQVFPLAALVILLIIAISGGYSGVMLNIAEATFTGISPEKFSWWRYARFAGILLQTLAAEFLLGCEFAAVIPEIFAESLTEKKKSLLVFLACVAVIVCGLSVLMTTV